MKEVPTAKIKLTEVKELFDAGYEILGELRSEVNSPVVRAKFLNQEVIAIYGKEAAKIFYDPRNFKREGAMPKLVRSTLLGEEGVQTLDGEQHHHRKNYFMDLMTPERMTDYHDLLERNLSHELDKQSGTFELFSLTKNVLFKTICEWSGINLAPLSQSEISELADYQVAMFSGTVTSPVAHLRGVEDRKKSEKWTQGLIEEARQHPVAGKESLALYTFATATDLEGNLLPIEVAAVDLLNIIRPTVALTVWIALMGHALFSTTTIYQALKQNFSELQDSFIQELRRFYPFFPMMPAISLQDVVVDGYLIPKDSWVVQDIYGTNHDPRTFDQPDDFKVDRFVGRTQAISYEEEYEMIAQGGGDFRKMHRCAGEWITLHTLRVFSDLLINHYQFEVPEQDWKIPMNHFPTYPESKVLLFKEAAMTTENE